MYKSATSQVSPPCIMKILTFAPRVKLVGPAVKDNQECV